MSSGSALHKVGPEQENERRPYRSRLCRGTVSRAWSADQSNKKNAAGILLMSEGSYKQSTMEIYRVKSLTRSHNIDHTALATKASYVSGQTWLSQRSQISQSGAHHYSGLSAHEVSCQLRQRSSILSPRSISELSPLLLSIGDIVSFSGHNDAHPCCRNAPPFLQSTLECHRLHF